MDSLERAFSNGFAVISLALLLGFIVIMYGAAYNYADYKISGEHPNTTLVKSGSDIPTEDEDYRLYTGRTSYSTAFGDEVESNMRLEGDTYKTIHKDNVSSSVLKTGEAATGAAVFAEIKSLPGSVSTVTINGHVLYNDIAQPNQKSVGDHVNVAYFIERGLMDELIHECGIGFTQNYARSYVYDSKYKYIIGVVYTPV